MPQIQITRDYGATVSPIRSVTEEELEHLRTLHGPDNIKVLKETTVPAPEAWPFPKTEDQPPVAAERTEANKEGEPDPAGVETEGGDQ